MKQSEMPEWVLRHKGAGRTVKRTASGYALYTATSQYVKGGNPRSVQRYIGMITPEGVVPAKRPPAIAEGRRQVEYGVSRLVALNFSRQLKRSVYNSASRAKRDLIALATVKFALGDTLPFSVASCWAARGREAEISELAGKVSPSRVDAVCSKIASLLEAAVPDPEERSALVVGLRLCTVDADGEPPAEPVFPAEVAAIAERRGLRL